MALNASRAKSLFLTASDLADRAQRCAYLDRECGNDTALRARVEALLLAHDDSPLPSMESNVATNGNFKAESGQVGRESMVTTEYRTRLESGIVVSNRYILEQKIGEGGMGEVWVAKQTEPVKRRVALKLIKPGMDSRTVLARFDQERQALALMDHPNIAKVLDAGLTPTGQPFFVMELVNGLALNKFCDELKLTPRERLELFVPICQAVQHAHQKGIVHRDLKPANILITMIDGKPVPKVIDFGVAKATAGKLSDDSIATQFGSVVGTLEYMSPEQAGFSGEDIDTRSDIYSLGVILYEMLTGLKPIDAARVKKAALTEMIRIIREEDPSRPSTRLSTNESLPSLAALRRTEPNKLMSMLKGELDWVVMKCLEKQRERRYETANGLAREIQRYLADEMVEARPPSTRYRLGKFLRRYPLQLSLAGAISLLVLGGAGVVWWHQEQAGSRREAELRHQLEGEQRAALEVARNARNAEAVASLLGQCEDALRSDDGKRAGLVLEAAKKRSDEGGAEESGERISRLENDLVLLKALDEVDRFRWTPLEDKLPARAKVTERIREVLKRFDLEPTTSAFDLVISNVSSSVLRDRVVSAWDWLLRHGKNQLVRDVLRRVDPDPFRDAVRDAVLANDGKRVLELIDKKDADRQPPWFAAFLGESQVIPLERRRQFLQKAVWEKPGNLGLLIVMGLTFPSTNKENWDEKLRWNQAAIAAAPDNPTGYMNLGAALFQKKNFEDAIACCRKAIELDPKFAVPLANLGAALLENDQVDAAIVTLNKAIEIKPIHAGLHLFIYCNLGFALLKKGKTDEAIAIFQKAIELDPKQPRAYKGLGRAFKEKNQLDQAIANLQKAIELSPQDAKAHTDIGIAFMEKGETEAATSSYRKAIELNPSDSVAHTGLGKAFQEKGQTEAAIASYRKAIELNPKDAVAFNNLGIALKDKGQLDGAIACYHKAIELDPKLAKAHASLGLALHDKGQVNDAIACFRKAIQLDPKHGPAHTNLGMALWNKGQVDEAFDCYKKAIELDPKRAPAHYNLGHALLTKGRVDEALDSLKKAIDLDPNNGKIHWAVGRILMDKMRPDEAIAYFQKALTINPEDTNAKTSLASAKRFSIGLGKIIPYLKGEFTPQSNEDRLALIEVCQWQKHYHAGAELSAAAFASDPKLGDDVNNFHRYNAACHALLASTGMGTDSAKLDEPERSRLRRQALDWLKADLAGYQAILTNAGPPQRALLAQKQLTHWQTDPDLASIREKEPLSKLPPEEAKGFKQLWLDVAKAIQTAAEKQK